MVTFTKDGNFILVANEGEPNDDYTLDSDGTVSIFKVANNKVVTIDFFSFQLVRSNKRKSRI